MSSQEDWECSQIIVVGFRPFQKIAGSEDSDVLSEANKADKSDKKDIFNRDKMIKIININIIRLRL